MIRSAVALLAIPCMIAGAAAQAPSGATEKTATEGKSAEDRRVCRNIGTTGSRIPLRECHLQSEWKAIDLAQTSQAADMQRRMNDGVGGAAVTNSPIPR